MMKYTQSYWMYQPKCYSTSKSKRYLRWLVKGSSTDILYASVAFFLAALISSLI